MTDKARTSVTIPGRAGWVVAVAALAVASVAGCHRNEPVEPGNESRSDFALKADIPAGGAAFSNALYQSLGVRMLPGHQVSWHLNGEVFDAMVDDIKRAQRSVNVLMYIWEKGAASDRVVAALVERAKAGVACRVLVDDFGSMKFGENIQPALTAAGCEVRYFRPLPSGAKLARNHRKIVIVDGRVAYTGGLGIRDNWLGDGVHDEKWRDSNARFTGPAVVEAQQSLAENWQEAGGDLLPVEQFAPVEPQGPASVAFISSTASPVLTRAERLTQVLIAAARKRIWIENAYFVPSKPILELLSRKAASGVDVRILVAGKKSDSKTSFGVQQGLYGDLREKGAKVYEYQPSMMHAKTMLIDDRMALVGSMNLDPLSLNTLEDVAMLADDPAFAAGLAKQFEADVTHSKPIEK